MFRYFCLLLKHNVMTEPVSMKFATFGNANKLLANTSAV